ncbi:MOSC domain-containing protein [Mycobacterium sp. SMC-4]|uniref:MOSC domain-containing protein n=1 Tax=Mycobacterium sp. SMC-4 TaxID=2857059 RepID=UPI0021B3E7A2|nr:MOSC domain-containing protein [Mycobacterium sp. SMC-4]UXA21027.1 MOSC domain-containing protein [Mycobacterium sp. SMC-4]
MACVLTVNIATTPTELGRLRSGINKQPSAEPVEVRAPGSGRASPGSGLAGDTIGNRRFHGGDDQAVYAYAREDLDRWQTQLGRHLPNGVFGENLTTSGADLTQCVIGERWSVGDDGLVLEVTSPRTPCRTFTMWLDRPDWMKTFTAANLPGAYFRVIEPGPVAAGSDITVLERPGHGITVGTVFRALMTEPELLGSLAAADALPEKIKKKIARRM